MDNEETAEMTERSSSGFCDSKGQEPAPLRSLPAGPAPLTGALRGNRWMCCQSCMCWLSLLPKTVLAGDFAVTGQKH